MLSMWAFIGTSSTVLNGRIHPTKEVWLDESWVVPFQAFAFVVADPATVSALLLLVDAHSGGIAEQLSH